MTKVFYSVVDPNTVNLDPNPGFWPNLDPDPGFYYQFWKNNSKIIFLENNNYKNKMSLKDIFTQLSLWIVNFYLKSYTFLPPLYPIFTCVDPDPYSEYGSRSGSRKLLNTDPIRSRIHNTGFLN